jgi:hypothetical protein|tara:strand:+ start:143 stop:1375 length:1233 start_codon:yes stop_codon:yes gene_type:complete
MVHPLILAALIGGGTGGLSAAARGTDPMKGILTGAATGAITSGLGSMLSGGQLAAAEAAKSKLAEETIRNNAMKSMSAGSAETAKQMSAQLAKGQASAAAQKAIIPSNFKQAMDPFALAQKEKVGRMAYATTPAAAMTGEFLFNPPEKAKKKGPPLNMFYGRNPGRFMFGDWADPSKIEEIYEDKENPYYYPEYAEGGAVEQGMNMNAIARYAAEYLQGNGVEPTPENVQEIIEQVMEQQQSTQYQPMAGLGGQLQGMTQQYSKPMGSEMMEETETVQGMNQGGTPRRYYQEGGLGSLMGGMGDMMPSGDLDMRPGGEPVGPGTGTSDDIPAMLSDGEFVMTAAAVEGAGGGDRATGSERMMNMMKNFEQGGQPSPESQGLGGMEETTMTEMIGPQGMMMEEDTMMEGMA